MQSVSGFCEAMIRTFYKSIAEVTIQNHLATEAEYLIFDKMDEMADWGNATGFSSTKLEARISRIGSQDGSSGRLIKNNRGRESLFMLIGSDRHYPLSKLQASLSDLPPMKPRLYAPHVLPGFQIIDH